MIFRSRWLRALGDAITGFLREARAAAAVEFAVVAPVALLVVIGAAEVSDGVMASRKVSQVTRTLADLVSRQPTSSQSTSTPTPPFAVTSGTLTTLLTSAATLLYPQPSSPLTMTVSAVDITNTAQGICCSVLVRWTFTQGGVLRPCNQQLTALSGSSTYNVGQIPAGLIPTGTVLANPIALIIADVAYTYQPLFNASVMKFTPSMQRTEYMLPRSVGQVITGALPSSGSPSGTVCY